MGKEIETLQQMIDESSKIVFFGGAGVSTESGIPDFRAHRLKHTQATHDHSRSWAITIKGVVYHREHSL